MKRPSPRVGRGPAWSPGLVLAACLLATVIRPAAAQSGDALPVLPAPAVSAEAGLLVDLATGKVLYAKNAEGDRAPASLVKLMTLYIAYDDLRAGKVTLPEPVSISQAVTRTPRFRMGLVAGQTVPFEVLLQGVGIASANDAAEAVAEHLAGSEELFVERMNAEARRMGLSHTVFANPHGLPDPRQRTTARDIAALAENLLQDFPESRAILGDNVSVRAGKRIENAAVVRADYVTGKKPPAKALKGHLDDENFVVPLSQ